MKDLVLMIIVVSVISSLFSSNKDDKKTTNNNDDVVKKVGDSLLKGIEMVNERIKKYQGILPVSNGENVSSEPKVKEREEYKPQRI